MIRSKPHTMTAKTLADVIRNVQESEARLRDYARSTLRAQFDAWLASNPSELTMFGAFVAGVRSREAGKPGFISDDPVCQPG